MKPWIETLLSLQSLDMKLRGIETKLATFPSEKARITSEAKEAESKMLAVRNEYLSLQRKIKDSEGKASAAAEEVKKLLIQSASVKKSNEYQAMMQSIESKKELQSNLETETLTLMDSLEPLKKRSEAAEKEYNVTIKGLREEVAELKEFAEELKKQYKETLSLRAAYEKNTNQQALEIYKRLLPDKSSEPLVPIQDGICGACRLRLTPQTINNAKRGDITQCDNCSHLLYIPDQT